jgi:anti-sigma28 factor (negative regulator of flagellin synthesis)
MDPFDNSQTVKRPNDGPASPDNETETRMAQPSGSESLVQDAHPLPMDEARAEKIETLKKAVADGTYSVSAEEVARKLIEHMLEPKE